MQNLKEIFVYFLRLGVFGFGGPLALIGSFQKDLVETRGWISKDRFANSLALIKAMPGPTATQVAIFLGSAKGGRVGGIIAGSALIFPSFVMMILLGLFETQTSSVAIIKDLLFGMQAAALGVIIDSVWRLAKPFKSDMPFLFVALIAAIMNYFFPASEPIVIISSGILGAIFFSKVSKANLLFAFPISLPAIPFFQPGVENALMWTMFKAGAFVFGTGLAIVPMLMHDVVDTHHWLTHDQFMNALAFGQITPGPVTITSTYIGYQVAGVKGAILATFCMFAPAFINILTWFQVVERKSGQSAKAKQFSRFALGAVVGSLFVSLLRLIQDPFTHLETKFLSLYLFGAVAALVLMLRSKLPPWLTILGVGICVSILRAFFS